MKVRVDTGGQVEATTLGHGCVDYYFTCLHASTIDRGRPCAEAARKKIVWRAPCGQYVSRPGRRQLRHRSRHNICLPSPFYQLD